MRDIEHDIRPGVGLGALRLGSSEQSVRALLGDPPDVKEVDYGDGINTHVWEFKTLSLSLSFSEDDGYRLGTITTSYEWATLGDSRIVGLTEAELLENDFGGLGSPKLDDDFGEPGRDYCWDALSLSCWVRDGKVVSVSIMPLYDDTGNIPQWPNEVG